MENEMDAATATVIAALIGAASSVAVALITTRNRRDVQVPVKQTFSPTPSQHRQESELFIDRILRYFHVFLISVIYLMAMFFIAAGVEDKIFADENGEISLWPLILGIVFLIVAVWAHRRLRHINQM
jgi:hypothetical protein